MKTDQQNSAANKKRPYEAPKLKKFGSLQRMTQTGNPNMAALDFDMFSYVDSN